MLLYTVNAVPDSAAEEGKGEPSMAPAINKGIKVFMGSPVGFLLLTQDDGRWG